ncbi:MAG: penicillin-binding protein, partial [Bacilli bacterium]
NPKTYYQTQLGLHGKNLSLQTKEQIEALKLPGIEFETQTTRFYPNGTFASSTIGYAVFDEKENRIVGKLGVEQTYDDILKGVDGHKTIEVDASGFERRVIDEKVSVDGQDVYLNIDNTIQRLVETSMDEMLTQAPAQLALAVVTDAKTNEILALTNRPTFNPNILDISDYQNPFVSNVFEPGSVFKIFTTASLLEAGMFPRETYYPSQSVWIHDNGVPVQEINNYTNSGWGNITFEEGFMRSSNTAYVYLFDFYADVDVYGDYLDRFGFYKETGIEIPGEAPGFKSFDLRQEKITTAFGQASATTPVQIMQAFSAISNNGMMMKPYLTKKIVDNKNDKVTEFKPTQLGQVISPETSKEVLKLMEGVQEDPRGTGYGMYTLDDYVSAGKSGTAQVVENGTYLSCSTCYYLSYMISAPSDNPVVNIYLVTKFQHDKSFKERSDFIKTVTNNTLSYLDVEPTKVAGQPVRISNQIEVESFINKSRGYTQAKLDSNGMKYDIIGDGDQIIAQYPNPYERVSSNQKIYLLSNGSNKSLPNLTGLSKSDIIKIASLLNINVIFEGQGYASYQSIEAGSIINDESLLSIKLE